MRDNEHYALDDPEAVKDLIRQYPWCTFVSATPALVASHYPVMLVVARVVEALRRPGPYRNPRLAEHMATTRRPAPIGSVR